jgi:hypothetical protein
MGLSRNRGLLSMRASRHGLWGYHRPMHDGAEEISLLYKYRSLGDQWGRSAAEDIILHNRIFWQSPDKFNDPFDCNPHFIFGRSEKDRRGFRKRALSHMKGVPRHVRLAKRRELEAVPPERSAEILSEGFKQWMAESAVTCFSRVNDSLLMWAHYANSHSGVCFEFQERLPPDTFLAFEVDYVEERPEVDATSFRETEVFRQAVLTKGTQWSYEREYRMIEYREKAGYREFPSDVLKGVIFGHRISSEDRDFVMKLIEQRPHALELYEAVPNGRFFRMDIRKLD